MFSSSTLTIVLQTDTLFTNIYTAEDTSQMALRGSVVLNTSQSLKVRRLSLQFSGKLSMQFPASIKKTRRDLVDQTVILFEYERATPICGQHTFPFELLVPSDLPESFRGEFGKIKYTLKAVAETPLIKSDLKTEVPVQVQRTTDLHQEFTSEYMVENNMQGTLACKVTLPTSEYLPGEKLDIQVSTLPLEDGVSVTNVTCTLKEYTQFHIPSKSDQSRVSVAEYMKRLNIITKSFNDGKQMNTLLMKVPEDASCSCINTLVEITHILSVRISWEYFGRYTDFTTISVPINIVSLIGTPEFDQLPKYQTIELPPTYNVAISKPENEVVPICLPPSYHNTEVN